jgi:hypothetical protein
MEQSPPPIDVDLDRTRFDWPADRRDTLQERKKSIFKVNLGFGSGST